jgi:hypothetical protein
MLVNAMNLCWGVKATDEFSSQLYTSDSLPPEIGPPILIEYESGWAPEPFLSSQRK